MMQNANQWAGGPVELVHENINYQEKRVYANSLEPIAYGPVYSMLLLHVLKGTKTTCTSIYL